MKMKILRQTFSVCTVPDLSKIDIEDEFCFVGKTDEEISLVCDSQLVPDNATACEPGWRAFRIEGVLDFSLIGVLSKISTLLADHHIGIFVVSTFRTDYILVKAENFERAREVLRLGGHEIESMG